MKFFWIILIVVGFVATYFLAQTSTTGNGIYYYLIYGWLLLILYQEYFSETIKDGIRNY